LLERIVEEVADGRTLRKVVLAGVDLTSVAPEGRVSEYDRRGTGKLRVLALFADRRIAEQAVLSEREAQEHRLMRGFGSGGGSKEPPATVRVGPRLERDADRRLGPRSALTLEQLAVARQRQRIHFLHEPDDLAPPEAIPPPAHATRALAVLAADRGIQRVLDETGYKIGELVEMPPDGKVGVSNVCVLGLNTNAGQRISLRLRTDDLHGFRRYPIIIRTLLHELTHCRFSDHNADFKTHMGELRRIYEATPGHGVREYLADRDEAHWHEPDAPTLAVRQRLGTGDGEHGTGEEEETDGPASRRARLARAAEARRAAGRP
jgi:hypothetical protein